MEEIKNQEIKKPRLPLYARPDTLSEKIIADYKNGLTKKESEIKDGRSAKFDGNCLNDHDIENNKRISIKEEPAWMNTAVEMYYNGNTLAEISERVGIHTWVLLNRFKNTGATEEKKRRKMESFQPVIDAWNDGLTESQLLEKYPQFSKNNIRHIVHKFCPKRKGEVCEDEIIENLPKAERKAQIRLVRVEKKVYSDITDIIAGV